MSVDYVGHDVLVRQSDADYYKAEYERRGKEEAAAWDAWVDAGVARRVAVDRAKEFRYLFMAKGLNPFTGDAGVVEDGLWDEVMVANRDQDYAAAVWRSKAALKQEAWVRYMEVL